MGIKGLPAYIRKWCDNVYVSVPAGEFRNHFIAIDADSYTHRFAAGSQTCQQYLAKFINLIVSLKSEGVHPVFIFDGGAPQEKWAEQQKRREAQDAVRAEIARLEAEDDEYGINQDRIAALSKRLTSTPAEYKQALAEILEHLGIPVFRAPDEAERMCAALVTEKKVALTLSPDSDLWVYGIDFVATDYEQHTREFSIVSPSNIIKTMGLSRAAWVDFCIMCGCDYNQNMPGIGPAKSFDLIQEHGSIEALPEKYDTRCLKHQRCRELFSHQKSGVTSIKNKAPTPQLKNVLTGWGVAEYYPKISKSFGPARARKMKFG